MPLLHGLCTYGITAKAVFETFHQQNPAILEKISARFTSHVFPGDNLIIDMWKDDNTVIFKTKTKERGLDVLKGFCKLKS